VTLTLAKVVAHPHHTFGHGIAAELISQAGDVMKIKFRFDENVVSEKDLNADSEMRLKMIRRANGFRGSAANSGSHASAFGKREAGARASNATFEQEDCAFGIDGRIDAVDVIEGLARIQRAVSLARGLQVGLESHAEMFVQHQVTAKAEKEASERGQRLTIRVTRVRCARAERIDRRGVIYAAGVRAVPRASKSEIDVE
jgi:hypothetical protein